jgi:hypothetical protein
LSRAGQIARIRIFFDATVAWEVCDPIYREWQGLTLGNSALIFRVPTLVEIGSPE